MSPPYWLYIIIISVNRGNGHFNKGGTSHGIPIVVVTGANQKQEFDKCD